MSEPWPETKERWREYKAWERLVAAAPDLYEALSQLLEHYVALANSGDAGFWDPEEEPKVKAARDALSKANAGRTPTHPEDSNG